MTWRIWIDDGPGFEVASVNALEAAVTGVLLGSGLNCTMSATFGRSAGHVARLREEQRRENWNTKPLNHKHAMADGRVIRIVSLGNPPEDPTRRCDGYDSAGNHCGRNMDHLGAC